MKNAIVLSKNFEKYRSGYYHQDIVNSLCKKTNCYVYGPGYDGYDSNHSIDDIVKQSGFSKDKIDYIIMTTSWDVDTSIDCVDPHPKIVLADVTWAKKIYFLNKEYKKLDQRFDYCKKNQFDLILTVHPNAELWAKEHGLNIIQCHFGIDLERFKYQSEEKTYDFGFTGSLHGSHLDYRGLVKKELFKENSLKFKSNLEWKTFGRNVIDNKYQNYNIYWAEFGAKGYFANNLLPFGSKYGKFLKKFKMFLNTPSAVGIFNTRFFELMASNTLILCPKVDKYYGLLEDRKNCLMFNPDMTDFYQVFQEALSNEELRNQLISNASKDVHKHSYDARIEWILSTAENL